MTLKTEIRQTVAQYLKANAMGQARFARAVGIGAGAVNDLLKNRRPSVAVVARLDDFFQVGGTWLKEFEIGAEQRRRARNVCATRSIKCCSLAKYVRLHAPQNNKEKPHVE